MKKTIIIACLLLSIAFAWGQRSDSLSCGYNHQFSFGQAIAPATLFTCGAIVAEVPSFHQNIDFAIRDRLQADGHPRFEIEDYLQFAPGVSVFVLKSFGLPSQHSWRDLASLSVSCSLFQLVICNGIKYTVREERPYGGVFNSFPSGHTMTAFMCAEFLRREYGKDYPGIAVAGYTLATGVGFMRMYNNRHYLGDVLAGAGLGILCTSLSYWIAPYLRF